MDDQICAVVKRTGEEKVCCRNEQEVDDLETSGGTRLEDNTAAGGIINLQTDSVFDKCSSM